MFELALKFNVVLIAGMAVMFSSIGLLFRTSKAGKIDRDNLVYSDGFQGASIASLFLIAVVVYYIEDPKSVQVLKEQASLVVTFSLLGCIQFGDRFRRSLRQ